MTVTSHFTHPFLPSLNVCCAIVHPNAESASDWPLETMVGERGSRLRAWPRGCGFRSRSRQALMKSNGDMIERRGGAGTTNSEIEITTDEITGTET